MLEMLPAAPNATPPPPHKTITGGGAPRRDRDGRTPLSALGQPVGWVGGRGQLFLEGAGDRSYALVMTCRIEVFVRSGHTIDLALHDGEDRSFTLALREAWASPEPIGPRGVVRRRARLRAVPVVLARGGTGGRTRSAADATPDPPAGP